MLYEEKVTTNKDAFIAKVITISQRLGIEPEWLMQVFVNESGINHQAVNSVSGATGLIQFMPNTATALGTSVAALKAMTNVQQLDWVYKYLSP
jgi:soluble lytic murein transglycosylase-like protein